MSQVRSDRPTLMDPEQALRSKRARRILEVFEQIVESKIKSDQHRTTTQEWLERCLLAHEQDTLVMALRASDS